MAKHVILIFLFLFISRLIHSQNHAIFGYMVDITTGEKLIGASVYSPPNKKGVATSSQGYFSLSLPKGSQRMTFSYVGYETKELSIYLYSDTLVEIKMIPNSILREVEITAGAGSINNDRPNTISLPIKEIKALPALGGEVDVIKAIQRLPGIKAGHEGTTGLYVRGGSPDQNLILLDGVPVYNIAHLFGFVSIFDASSISHLEVIKGGFPARYGGRLASVVNIQTKDGNLNKVKGEVEAGIISTKLFIEGPIKKDVASFTFSARRSFYELYTLPQKWISQDGEFNNLGFHDLNMKINFHLSPRDKISFASYFGRDALNLQRHDVEDTIKETNNRILKWGNAINQLRWNRLWGDKIISSINIYSNYYSYGLTAKREHIHHLNNQLINQRVFLFSSNINDLGSSIDFNFYPSPNHSIKFGGNAIQHQFKPGFSSTKIISGIQEPIDTNNKVAAIRAFESRVYLEDNFQVVPSLALNLGVHGSMFGVQGKRYTSMEPRVSLSFSPKKNWGFSASFTTMKQYLHLLSNSGLGIPADLWVPPTNRVSPQKAWQTSIGWSLRYPTGLEFAIDAYYKKMRNLIDYKPGSSFLIEGSDWEEKVALNGKGKSKGIEFFFRKTKGRLTGMAGYTLSYSDRSFLDIDNGKNFPFRYDRRHDFQVSSSYSLNSKILLNSSWTFYTGNPVTLPVAIYPSTSFPPIPNQFLSISDYDIIDFDPSVSNSKPFQEGVVILNYGAKNNQRLPSYHRLDVSIQFHRKKKKGERTWSVQVYNIYNGINPYYIRYSYSGGSVQNPLDSKGEFQIVSLFQIIPSISYAYKF